MSRRLFGWFGPKRGEKVLEMVEKHLELTKNAVISLYQMVGHAAECNLTESKSSFLELSKMEQEADKLRRDMVEELTKGEMFPEERDDLMELVRSVDWIADWSKEAGRLLSNIPFDKAPEEIKTATLNILKTDVDCVKVLVNSIHELHNNPANALSLADEVEMLEETVDDLYGDARKYFATLDFQGFGIGSLILLNEFIDALETIADWCENTADIVRAIAVRKH